MFDVGGFDGGAGGVDAGFDLESREGGLLGGVEGGEEREGRGEGTA